jgi:extradiol dioxygenase family protein
MTNKIRPFHLAIAVSSIVVARQFYGDLLGFTEGRSSENWVDWNFFGHQLVTHLDIDKINSNINNPVDGHNVPVPHFGVILDFDDWNKFSDSLKSKNIKFVIEPYIRFRDSNGEQATMFFLDPFGNALEFKAFRDDGNIFKKF